MYVCVCKAVTERQIHEAAAAGASRLRDLHRELGVASDCGRCASCARDCLREAQGASFSGKSSVMRVPVMMAVA
jgi:bacterioferritin-associated ferredoxin